MTERQQLGEDLEWHVIYGAPYFVREEREGVFRIIKKTSTIFRNGLWCMVSELDGNFGDLVLREDIEEFKPENNQLGILLGCNDRADLNVIRGLRHLARLERALYFTFQKIGEKGCYGTYVQSFESDLVLARFFNRKYDTGIDPHAV